VPRAREPRRLGPGSARRQAVHTHHGRSPAGRARRTARSRRPFDPSSGRPRAVRTHDDAAQRARLVAQRALVAQAPVRPQAAVAHAHVQEHLRRAGSSLAAARSWRLPRCGGRADWHAGLTASGRVQLASADMWQACRLARRFEHVGVSVSPTRAAHPASRQLRTTCLRHSAPHHVCDGEVILLHRARLPAGAPQQRARRGEHGAAARRVRSRRVRVRRALTGSPPLLPAWRTACQACPQMTYQDGEDPPIFRSSAAHLVAQSVPAPEKGRSAAAWGACRASMATHSRSSQHARQAGGPPASGKACGRTLHACVTTSSGAHSELCGTACIQVEH
jgi:hypothetical protein